MCALQSLVPESFQIYFYIAEIMAVLIERFMELEAPDCMKVLDILCQASRQFIEVENFYNWCKAVGIGRSSEYPQVETITPKKLVAMEKFILDKAALAHSRKAAKQEPAELEPNVQVQEEQIRIKALPALEEFIQEIESEEIAAEESTKEVHSTKEANLIDTEDDAVTVTEQEYGDSLTLALFEVRDRTLPPTWDEVRDGTLPPAWESFDEPGGWEMALVQSTSKLSNQKVALGGGFDMLLLDNMYQQGPTVGDRAYTGSASSMAIAGAASTVLALPAPPAAGNRVQREDPFAASVGIAPPAYVQMWDMEKKQQLLLEEQLMWEQYARNGMQGHYGLGRLQGQHYPCHMGYGGYPQSYWS